MTNPSRFMLHIFVLSFTFVLLQSTPAAVKTAPDVTVTTLGSINEASVDSTVDVEATVKSISMPREGSKAPVRINLADDTGTLPLVVWPDIYDVIKAQSPIEVGAKIRAHARVSTFRDNLQLQIKVPGDIQLVSKSSETTPAETPAPASATATTSDGLTPVSNVTTAMMGREVTVQATISDIREPRSDRAPYIVTLSQDDARLPLVFWSDIEPQLKDKLKVGNVVRVKAQVSEHRGTLQIKLRNAADFSVVTAPE